MILVALGANLPSREGAHRETLRRVLPLFDTVGLTVKDKSSIWLTEPVPRSDHPWYANQVVSVTTSLAPEEVLDALLALETLFDRIRTERDAPRTLDLDLIAYDDAVLRSDRLILPHPRMHQRAFVLAPLSEIAPGFIHPVLGRSVSDLLAASDRTGICRLRPVPMLMGVVNVTPDSFSDGSDFLDPDAAIRHAVQLMDEGADILDIGGESTRPGSQPVSPVEERSRIMPVIDAIAEDARRRGRLLSIDTRHASTMTKVLEAGASMINDVTALADPASRRIVAEAGVPVVLMHMLGDPKTMQQDPRYEDVVAEVGAFLDMACARAMASGVCPDNLWVDPGIGFGKTLAHNVALLNAVPAFAAGRRHVLVGASRKAFISRIDRNAPAKDRLGGSIAAALSAAEKGASAIRVHDVAATRQALAVWSALAGA